MVGLLLLLIGACDRSTTCWLGGSLLPGWPAGLLPCFLAGWPAAVWLASLPPAAWLADWPAVWLACPLPGWPSLLPGWPCACLAGLLPG